MTESLLAQLNALSPREAEAWLLECCGSVDDAGARRWSKAEQSGIDRAADDVRARLAAANAEYERRFGHIFIVCATGKSAAEMLGLLEARMTNEAGTETRIAAEEQRKIMQLRLRKMLGE